MGIDAKLVKTLREKTGAGMMDCKKALVDSDGDINKAVDNLRKTGMAKAEKKGTRDTKEGLVYSYIHAGGRLGVLIELNCETDFVAKTEGFNELAHNLSMQIAAGNPISIDKDSLDAKLIEKEKSKLVEAFSYNFLQKTAYSHFFHFLSFLDNEQPTVYAPRAAPRAAAPRYAYILSNSTTVLQLPTIEY